MPLTFLRIYEMFHPDSLQPAISHVKMLDLAKKSGYSNSDRLTEKGDLPT
jgi:hypothetical protein